VYQRDFILRMIEMLAELIAGILGLIKKGDFQLASKILDNAYFDFLKQDAAFFRGIDKEELTDDLINKHNYTNGHLDILSELFYAEAELLYAQGSCNRSLEFYEKALILKEYVVEKSKSFSLDTQSKITFLKNRLDQLKTSGA